MELYTPVLALAILAAGFAVFSVVVSSLTGPKRYNRAKLDSYECGIEPTPAARGRRQVPGALLHHRDDVHRLRHRDRVPLPDRRRLRPDEAFGLIEMVLFIVPVFIAYVYVWRRGGLDWD